MLPEPLPLGGQMPCLLLLLVRRHHAAESSLSSRCARFAGIDRRNCCPSSLEAFLIVIANQLVRKWRKTFCRSSSAFRSRGRGWLRKEANLARPMVPTTADGRKIMEGGQPFPHHGGGHTCSIISLLCILQGSGQGDSVVAWWAGDLCLTHPSSLPGRGDRQNFRVGHAARAIN
jgi:hypothetical protein